MAEMTTPRRAQTAAFAAAAEVAAEGMAAVGPVAFAVVVVGMVAEPVEVVVTVEVEIVAKVMEWLALKAEPPDRRGQRHSERWPPGSVVHYSLLLDEDSRVRRQLPVYSWGNWFLASAMLRRHRCGL